MTDLLRQEMGVPSKTKEGEGSSLLAQELLYDVPEPVNTEQQIIEAQKFVEELLNAESENLTVGERMTRKFMIGTGGLSAALWPFTSASFTSVEFFRQYRKTGDMKKSWDVARRKFMSGPYLKRMITTYPQMVLPLLKGDKSPEMAQAIEQEISRIHTAVPVEESYFSSTVPAKHLAAAAAVPAILGRGPGALTEAATGDLAIDINIPGHFMKAMNQYIEDTGNEDPTIGDVWRYMDRNFKSWLTERVHAFAEELPEAPPPLTIMPLPGGGGFVKQRIDINLPGRTEVIEATPEIVDKVRGAMVLAQEIGDLDITYFTGALDTIALRATKIALGRAAGPTRAAIGMGVSKARQAGEVAQSVAKKAKKAREARKVLTVDGTNVVDVTELGPGRVRPKHFESVLVDPPPGGRPDQPRLPGATPTPAPAPAPRKPMPRGRGVVEQVEQSVTPILKGAPRFLHTSLEGALDLTQHKKPMKGFTAVDRTRMPPTPETFGPVRMVSDIADPKTIDDIKMIEVDPVALRLEGDDRNMGFYRMLIEEAEEKGIPVFQRPLFKESEVTSIAPYIDKSMEMERAARGMSQSEMLANELSSMATATGYVDETGKYVSSADVAAAHADAIYVRTTEQVGENVRHVLGDKPSGWTQQDLDDYVEAMNRGPADKRFLPNEKPIPIQVDHEPPRPPGRGRGRRPDALPGDPRDVRLLPESSATAARQAGKMDWGGFIRRLHQDPQDFYAGDPIGEQILDLVTRGRLMGDDLTEQIRNILKPAQDAIRANYSKVSRALFDLGELAEDSPEFVTKFKGASKEVRAGYMARKRAYDQAWQVMVEKRPDLYKGVDPPKRINDYNPHVWNGDEFARGAVPVEIAGERTTGNAAFRHLKDRFGAQGYARDAAMVDRAYFAGWARKVVWEPIWKDILRLADQMPHNKRQYANRWVSAMKGEPALLTGWWRNSLESAAKHGAAGKLVAWSMNSVDQLTSLAAHLMYRGALFGNTGFAFLNLFTQGILNPAAKHGWGATMFGIAKHADDAWRKARPNATMMGGFKSIYKDLPILGTERGLVNDVINASFRAPGMIGQAFRELRSLVETVENMAGPQATELVDRGIATHIGMADAMERWSQKLKRRVTIHNLMDGTLEPRIVDDIRLTGVKASDDINFIYGVHGSNPEMRMIFGNKPVALTTMFMSYYGKQLGFFYRGARRGDPGLILRYFMTVGLLDRIGAQVNVETRDMAIDREIDSLFKRAQYGRPPIGPPATLALRWIQFTHQTAEGDEFGARRTWKDFSETMGLAVPGIIEYRRMQHAQRQMDARMWINRYSGESIKPLEDNEVIQMFLGATPQSAADENKIYQQVRQRDRAMRAKLDDIGMKFAQAMEDADPVRMDAIIQEAAKFGLPIQPSVDRHLEKRFFPRMLRLLRTSKDMPLRYLLDQLMEEEPGLFDERAHTRANRIIRDLQEEQRKRLLQQEMGLVD